jgi:hypothetical protein
LSGHHGRLRRQRIIVLARATALNQQRQKQDDVDGEHCEENLLETFSPIKLRVANHGP